MSEIGTLLQNRYLINEKIGVGGMGAVYLAVDKRFDNHVAIKETFYKEDEFADAFEREAKLLNGLQHPNLPHVSDYFSEENGYFLVMQYIEGEDLSDKLKREGAFPVTDVVHWLNDLLNALDFLHTQDPPVIHRDIKPHNLKLTPRGTIMLLDFGLAKLNQKDATEVSVFGYSRTYSPLEQIQGTGTDARSDIFALGATAYHLITGKPPINALTRAAAIVGGETDPLPLVNTNLSEIPEGLASVIHTAMALNPQNRFVTAKAMKLALEYASSEIEVSEAPKISPAANIAPAQINNDQDFPALESFAAAKKALDSSSSIKDEPPVNVREKSLPKPVIVDVAPNSDYRNGNPRTKVILAAAAVLLLFGIVAAFYFSSGNRPAEATTQVPVANAAPTVAENRESLTKATTIEKKEEKAKPEASKTTRSAPKSQPKQSPVKEDAVIVDEQPVEEIDETLIEEEAPKDKVKPRRNRREFPDEMSEEEFRQLKREERQRRRQRRERQIPYEDQLN